MTKVKVKPGVTMMPKVLVTASPGTGSGITVADALGITLPGRKKPSKDLMVPGVIPPAIMEALAPQPMAPLPNSSPIVPLLQGNTAIPGLPPGVVPFNPEGSAQMPQEAPSVVSPQVAPSVAADTLNLQNLPAPPSIMEALAPPRRDTKAEQQRVNNSIQMALLGNLISGGQNMPGNVAAALTGARVGNDTDYARQVQQFELLQNEQDVNEKRRQQQYGQNVDTVQAGNQNVTTVAQLKEAAARARAQEAKEAQAETGRRADDRRQLITTLAALDPASQQQTLAVLEKTGELTRLGIPYSRAADGSYTLATDAAAAKASPLQKAAPQKAIETPQQQRARRLEKELGEQYDLFSNPRLTAAAGSVIASRIAEIKAALGIGNGEKMGRILADMTPAQRAQIDANAIRFTETVRRNKKTEEQAASRITISQAAQALRQKAATDRATRLVKSGGDATKAYNAINRRIADIDKTLNHRNRAGELTASGRQIQQLEDERYDLQLERDSLRVQVPTLKAVPSLQDALRAARSGTLVEKFVTLPGGVKLRMLVPAGVTTPGTTLGAKGSTAGSDLVERKVRRPNGTFETVAIPRDLAERDDREKAKAAPTAGRGGATSRKPKNSRVLSIEKVK